MSGPLADLKVVELTDAACAWAGKLLADLGADVVVVEPPGGSAQRGYGPWLDDEPGPERSLWWWHSNTNKQSVVLALPAQGGTLAGLLADADILIEAEEPGALAAWGLGDDRLAAI